MGKVVVIATTRASKRVATGPEIKALDHGRFAFMVDGIVRFAGSREECERRLAILTRPHDRVRQDHMLGRLFR